VNRCPLCRTPAPGGHACSTVPAEALGRLIPGGRRFGFALAALLASLGSEKLSHAAAPAGEGETLP
jgi:hypothetical protein